MKKLLIAFVVLLFSGSVLGQISNVVIDTIAKKDIQDNLDKENADLKKIKETMDSGKKIMINQGTTSRISFMMGIGASVSFDKIYQMPVVSPIDNTVKMEIGQRGKVSATFGISYTPYLYKIYDIENTEGY